jgi:hypothetical protein
MKLWSGRRYILLSLMFSSTISSMASALTIDWARQLGTNGYDHSTGVSTDGTGNIYVSGATGGSLTSPFGGGYYDAFLSKYDVAGNVQWTRQIGTSGWDEANDVAVDRHGSVYIAGQTSGTLGTSRVAGSDSFVTKYDAAGNLLWTSQFGTKVSPYASQGSSSLSADAVGNVYVTGFTAGDAASSNTDAFVTKLDDAGNLVWTRQFGTNLNDRGEAISADDQGNIFVTGTTYGSLGGSKVGPSHTSDAFVTKLDSTGNVLWSRQLGGNRSEFGFAGVTDGIGNIYIAGAADGSLTEHYGGGFHDAFLAKYDAEGNVIWLRQLGGPGADEAYGMTLDSSGAVYMTGNSDMLTDEDRSPRIGNSFVAKYDADGRLLWAEELGERGARAIAFDSVGGLFVAGRTYESLDGPNAGAEDAFLAKISHVPEPDIRALGVIGPAIMCISRWPSSKKRLCLRSSRPHKYPTH